MTPRKQRLNNHGGNASNGTNCGLAYLNANNGLGNANWNIAGRDYKNVENFSIIQRLMTSQAFPGRDGVRRKLRKITMFVMCVVKHAAAGVSFAAGLVAEPKTLHFCNR